jgi:hypothetical protein
MAVLVIQHKRPLDGQASPLDQGEHHCDGNGLQPDAHLTLIVKGPVVDVRIEVKSGQARTPNIVVGRKSVTT